MSYIEQTWVDYDPDFPLSGERLTHMETGIGAAHEQLDNRLGAAKLARTFALNAEGLLARSNPLLRDLAKREVITVAPAIAVGAGASAIANGVTAAYNDPRFTFGCDTQIIPSGNWVRATQPRQSPANGNGFANDVINNTLPVYFGFEGDTFEIRTLRTSAAILISVDDKWVSVAPTTTDGVGTTAHIKVTFANRQRHVIGVYIANGFFGGIVMPRTAAVWPVSKPATPRIAWLSDSYSVYGPQGTYNHGIYTYTHQVGRRLGMFSDMSFAASGTGFIKANPGPGAGALCGPYLTRVPDLIASKPDIVVVQSSLNDDQGNTPAAVAAAAAAVYDALIAGLPGTPIIASGTMDARPTAAQGYVAAKDAAVKAQATLRNIPWIDTAGWVYGTGNFGAPTGDGNADFVTYGDNIHAWAPEGTTYLGDRFAPQLINALAGITA